MGAWGKGPAFQAVTKLFDHSIEWYESPCLAPQARQFIARHVSAGVLSGTRCESR